MLIKQITIINKLGLHARASAKWVALTSGFSSQIHVIKDTMTVNGKSIMGIMTLTASQGTILTLHIEGDDQEALWHALEDLVQNRFGEDE